MLDELHKIPASVQCGSTPRFASIQADVGDRPSLQRLVSETVAQFGRLDAVVSNAGWTRITNFANLEEGMIDEDWDRCVLYNVKAHLWLLHAAKPELEKAEGAFVTTASVAGVKPSGSSLPYAVTKAAAIHLSKSLAVICSPKIRVNSVSPSILLTDWGMKFPEETREAAREATKLKRLATVKVSRVEILEFQNCDETRSNAGSTTQDVADQVRTLVMSKSITGQNIVIDSGFSL